MLAPLCCWSCNKRVGAQWLRFCQRVGDRGAGQCLDELGIERQCCRRMLLTVVELNTLFADHELAHEQLDRIKVERTCSATRRISCDGTGRRVPAG